MIYRLKEQKGDAIAVPQLVFAKLGIAEEYNVRVALYVLATGVTDPEKICADLKLRSKMSAESALAFWAGAGLLERYEENAAPGEEPSAPAPMTWAEIAAASRTDPMISSLIDCAQAGFARPLTHSEMEKLVNLYIVEGFAPETVMLCVAYVASRGKRTMGAVSHELKVWRAEGVESGEQADAHLQLLALRAQREQYVSGLLGIAESELTLGGRKAIARWYEVYGYDDAMVEEAAVQAGAKRDLWYWNSILKTWNAKGLRTVHDVRGPVAGAGASRNLRVDRETPSGNDFLKKAVRLGPVAVLQRHIAPVQQRSNFIVPAAANNDLFPNHSCRRTLRQDLLNSPQQILHGPYLAHILSLKFGKLLGHIVGIDVLIAGNQVLRSILGHEH